MASVSEMGSSPCELQGSDSELHVQYDTFDAQPGYHPADRAVGAGQMLVFFGYF